MDCLAGRADHLQKAIYREASMTMNSHTLRTSSNCDTGDDLIWVMSSLTAGGCACCQPVTECRLYANGSYPHHTCCAKWATGTLLQKVCASKRGMQAADVRLGNYASCYLLMIVCRLMLSADSMPVAMMRSPGSVRILVSV